MKLTPVLSINRYVSIDGITIVHICRSMQALDAYYDPPVIEDATEVWGTCNDEDRDSFHEIGRLEDVLKTIAAQPMVAAAAKASPRRFAQMVASAHELGRVIYIASFALRCMADRIADPKRFCAIEVDQGSLSFHTLLATNLFCEQRQAPGVYRISYSLTSLALESCDLLEPFPFSSWSDGSI
jgi:hypothetical protein